MMAGLTLAASILAAAEFTGAPDPQDAQCRVVRYAADGSRQETPPSRPYSRPSGVHVSSSASGGHARSSTSVSASSSSSGGGASVVRSESDGRSITKTYETDGCTVVIDARPVRGE
ncbi:hypothetical protein LJR219_001221 [Phenylobacterium sp. LjRoot219]|uniref:hypothetical protein n=1 Tax=Phenylobacterium sp. LjRoot219 TaxID=3342283 RepID=UPI003ED17368